MKAKSAPVHTFQTRLDLVQGASEILTCYANLMNHVERKLFAQISLKKEAKNLKNAFLTEYGITARQFNAVRVQLEGKIDSIRQKNGIRIQSLADHIAKLEKLLSQPKKLNKQKQYHQKNRLQQLQNKLNALKDDQAKDKIRLCFGTRKLFRKQFQGELSHQEWKEQWDFERNREFFTLGSKDEAGGNQTCTATLANDGSLTLRLRLPDALKMGKYLLIHNVRFKYGHEAIVSALESNNLRNKFTREKNPDARLFGQAISFRFYRDQKGWRVFASTSLPKIDLITDRRLGAIGIDINVDHLAVTETNRHGNIIATKSIPLNLYGKSHHQAKALIGDAIAKIVQQAKETMKPLVVEKLDFTKKKQSLKELGSKMARMLSSFSYSTILQHIRSRSYRFGVEVLEVNPAFTSLLGKLKFAKRYGISIHHAAALCIARRYYQYSEKLPLCSSVPDGKGGHVSFSVPVRNQKKSDWAYLGEVSGKWKAALAGHFRAASCRTKDRRIRRSCVENSSKVAGEIPACESLAVLLG